MKFRRPNQHFQIVAHRGLPEDYPENTIIAYRHALMLHIDMLEIDVHYTKDKELVVIHDDTIDRTSNGTVMPCACANFIASWFIVVIS